MRYVVFERLHIFMRTKQDKQALMDSMVPFQLDRREPARDLPPAGLLRRPPAPLVPAQQRLQPAAVRRPALQRQRVVDRRLPQLERQATREWGLRWETYLIYLCIVSRYSFTAGQSRHLPRTLHIKLNIMLINKYWFFTIHTSAVLSKYQLVIDCLNIIVYTYIFFNY